MNSILKSTKYLQLCINITSIEHLDEGLENAKHGILKFCTSPKANRFI